MALDLQDDLGIMTEPEASGNKLGLQDDLGIMKPNSFIQDMGNQAVTDIKDIGILAQPILHPVKTFKGITDLISPKASDEMTRMASGTGSSADEASLRKESFKQVQPPSGVIQAVGQGISDRYGSLEKAGTTFVEHPFSEVLPDAMIAAGGAGLALKGAGAVSGASKLSEAGQVLENLSMAPINAAGGAVGKTVEGVGKGIEAVKDMGKANLENRIFNLYNTSVGAKLKNVGEAGKMKPQRLNAMKTISDNSDNLVLPSGEKTPQDRLDLLHSLKQTKQAVWEKVSQMSGGATDAGATIDMSRKSAIIQKTIDDTVKAIGEDALRANPSLLQSIIREAENAAQIGITNPSRAQQYMAALNKELAPGYAAGKGTDFSVLDFKRNLVNNLNEATESTIEETLKRSGYGDLRDQYAALKSSEKEILAAANKHLRQVGGQGGGVAHPLVNLWSIEEAMQAGGHALMGNAPAAGLSLAKSAAIKTASKFVDFMKNPDRKISKMFDLLKKYEGGIKPGSGSVSVEAELMPRAGSVPVNNKPAVLGISDKSIPISPSMRSGVDRPYENIGLPSPEDAGSQVIRQGGPSAPLAIGDKSVPYSPTMRTGVNQPANLALPAPKVPSGPVISQSGPVIKLGTSYKPPFDKGVTSTPKYNTPDAWKLWYKNQFAQEENFIHPAKEAKLQNAKFNEKFNPDNPDQIAKRAYEKQVQAKKMSEFEVENYTEKLKQQIAQRKFLSQSVHPKNMKSGELQDLNLNWVKGKNLNSGTGWDVVATNFDKKFPGILDKSKQIDEAMIEYAQTLTKEHQQALRQLINDAKRTPNPKKLK